MEIKRNCNQFFTWSGIGQFSGYFDVQLQKSLQGDVGREGLHAVVGYPVFGATFRALDLRTKHSLIQPELVLLGRWINNNMIATARG